MESQVARVGKSGKPPDRLAERGRPAGPVPWAARQLPADAAGPRPVPAPPPTVCVRALFLSDLHLGTRGCQADQLLSFLRTHDAELIYLVGDIVDGWQLKSGWYWPQLHNDVVQELLRKARDGAQIFYIPGNHDEFLRDFYGMDFGGIQVVDSIVHETLAGRRYLVIHGDLFDVVITQVRWLALLGDKAYDFTIALNTRFNAVRRRLGLPYWSLSQWVKLKVKNAVSFISDFEEALAAEAARQQADGVICGHIHCATMRESNGSHYVNCGDWVDSCTAVVEHHDGQLLVVHWAAQRAAANAAATREMARAKSLLSA
jgi:UDP-2,3-diacylglucosamine pyrophosphatase LpxH